MSSEVLVVMGYWVLGIEYSELLLWKAKGIYLFEVEISPGKIASYGYGCTGFGKTWSKSQYSCLFRIRHNALYVQPSVGDCPI